MSDDYEWIHETTLGPTAALTAEEWLREAWERDSRLWRVALPAAWRFGLGLRLGAVDDPTRVLGWHVTATTPGSITVDADSRLLRAVNIVEIDGDTLRWRTTVTYVNAVGRLLWAPARVIHERLVPRALARAVRRRR